MDRAVVASACFMRFKAWLNPGGEADRGADGEHFLCFARPMRLVQGQAAGNGRAAEAQAAGNGRAA